MAVDIVRAWKDPKYRKSLTPEEMASLPANPVGDVVLTWDELSGIAGGVFPITLTLCHLCPSYVLADCPKPIVKPK
jgi:mersacidin/lichenicidin family type 2 lantibiotic